MQYFFAFGVFLLPRPSKLSPETFSLGLMPLARDLCLSLSSVRSIVVRLTTSLRSHGLSGPQCYATICYASSIVIMMMTQKKDDLEIILFCGMDGTRTRDPLRDRQVF